MRSKTLAYAIGMSCATLGAASTTFMPAAAWAQATSTTQGPAQAGSFGGGAAVAPRLTLAEALSLAETANPTLRAKQAQLAAAEGVRTDANALLFNNPQLSVEQTRRSVPQAAQGDERRKEWSAGLSQTMEIAGQRGYRREAADAALAALRAEIADAFRSARTAAAERFYRVLALQERVALEEQALRLFESTAAAIQKRRAAGEDTKQPGAHRLAFNWAKGHGDLEVRGAAGQVIFVDLVGSLWFWNEWYRLDIGEPSIQARALKSRLVADLRVDKPE